MSLMPKESSKLIAKSSKNVFIEEEGVKILACEVSQTKSIIYKTIDDE